MAAETKNKEEVKKLVKEEFDKRGMEASEEVIDQLSEAASSDLDGVGGGMNVAKKVALTVGGAVAMAALGAGGMYVGKIIYNNKKGISEEKTTEINKLKAQNSAYARLARINDIELFDEDRRVTNNVEEAAYYTIPDERGRSKLIPF